MDGKLERAGDRWRLTFVRPLPHPPERVWRAVTEPEHLTAWFPADIEGERAAGARLRFVFREHEGPDQPGELLTYEPPKLLEFTWGAEHFRLALEPDGAGTVLTFVNTFDELGKAARDAAGWHTCLDLLACHLAGEAPPWEQRERWDQIHPGYVAAFGPDAATIGPPPTD
jgi:uncharacterized protein YndB with AHSA1/START domain